MKRLLYFFIFLISANVLFAQMSDSQITEYVKTESGKGKPHQTIATELMKRGVTQDQLLRLKSKAEQQSMQNPTQVSDKSEGMLRSNPIEETVADTEPSVVKSSIFGKNIFNQKNLSFIPSLNIPTPEDYKLGPGDEVIIDIWGASQTSLKQTISPEGSIKVDRLGPIYLNGMTIKDADSFIQNKFASLYSGISDYEGISQIKLTLGQIRTIQINIMGEVVVPGTYSVSSLSSVFHALYNAGGVNDIGSLRAIQLYRKGKLLETIDIYQYLLNGKSSSDIRLADGDIIIVPPYISLVKISGNVKRPMSYEMTFIEDISDLLKYAGGFTGDAFKDKISIVRKTGEYDKMFTITSDNYDKFILEDGDEIIVEAGLNLFENRTEVRGAVYRPGYYEVGEDIKTIKQLIDRAGGLRGNAFLDRAVLTREREDLTYETFSINLKSLLSGEVSDIDLKKNDMLLIASDNVLIEYGDFSIHGHVTTPGTYAFADNTSIEDLIIKAGGLLNSASTAKVDVSRRIRNPQSMESSPTVAEIHTFSIKDGLIVDGQSDFILKPYDQVYIRKSPGYIEQRNVSIEGEVLFPGGYTLEEKNERLSSIMRRGGGATPHAYTQGAKLIRQRTQDEINQQRKSVQRLSEIGSNDSISAELVDIERSYSVGIELNKALSHPNSEYDLVLKAGDRIVIPEYDNTIKINGAVMYPNTTLFKKGEKASHYIDQAGGFSDLAQKKRVYVVYMNGTVAKVKGSDRNMIQPGCSIIVPSKERKEKMSLAETISIGTSVTSMASVVALLINALTK